MKKYASLVQQKSPPSTYAIAALMDGEPKSVRRVAGLTLERAFFLGTGLFLSGLRGRQLIKSSVLASTAITAWIIGDYALRRRGAGNLTPFSD
tara:strand:+ start:918 stop:1196 length:279 start_codon:yes stop_codon:yes gene_type:complete